MKKIFLLILISIASNLFAQQKVSINPGKDSATHWLPKYDLNPAIFNNPPLSFGPLARWWWPGNDVSKVELKREINLFADNGFAGVEVQPLNLALPPANDSVRKRITSWDSPDYYDNLRSVMEEARKRNMIVDMTNGSGWPPAAPNLLPEDGFLSLEFSDTIITGGKSLSFSLPILTSAKNRTRITPRLQAIVMTKLFAMAANQTNPIQLDETTSRIITSSAKDGTLSYSFPNGQWRIIAFWAVPSGGQTNIAAAPKPMTIVDHFDSLKVLKLYNYLFGERTGLLPYFGNPMRSIFSDSYEFSVNRHFALNFIPYFLKKRGYDITPYLPANMQRGYNYVSYMRPNAQPDFKFSEQDWRLRYDYDITLNDILNDQFFKTSKEWTESRGLLFRTQAYGLNMDMIAMAGAASIPETENMVGSEMNLKIMTSGGHLYNRPIETAESVVFINRAYTTTPQKIKLAVDKLFAAGVNQIVYHGVPYRYPSDKFGPEGWFPFSSTFFAGINFSSNLGEGNIFWKYQKDVNAYINRTQYALRAGKSKADVLIYFPFLSVDGTPDNPEEIMTRGYVKEAEGPLPFNKEVPEPAKDKWAAIVYPMINLLEASGITWDWINDASIQEATLDNKKQINIRGNNYQALVLASDSIMQMKTAQQISKLSLQGMKLMAIGALPTKQPSFLNWKINDKKTETFIAEALKNKTSTYIKTKDELNNWIKKLSTPISFNAEYNFTREAQREMSDGSRIRFIWNKSDQWQTISLTLDKKFQSSYWMNADEGVITRNTSSLIEYQLAPYASTILFASTKNSLENLTSFVLTSIDTKKEVLSINKWNLKTDSLEVRDTALFDWKNHDQLKSSASEGIYTSSFDWHQPANGKQFYLDLGKVYYTAEVLLNGKSVGRRIFSPFVIDISSFLKEGKNDLEVRVTTAQLNEFIWRAKNSDPRYKQFKGKEDQIMSAGLIGPVVIRGIK